MTNSATSATRADQVAPLAQVNAAVAALRAVEVGRLLADEVESVAAALTTLDGQLAILRAAFIRRVDVLHAEGHAAAATDVLQRHGKVSGREAKRQEALAGTLAEFPALAEALGQGAVSSGHVDVLAGVVRQLDDAGKSAWRADGDDLARLAGAESPEGFNRQLQRRKTVDDALNGISRAEVEHKKNRATATDVYGRYQLFFDADAVTGLRIERALQAEMDAMRATGDLDELHPDLKDDIGHLRFYAGLRLFSRGLHSKRPNRTTGQVSEVAVLIDVDSLMNGLHEHSVCETSSGHPIEIETARRLACEGGIYPVVLSGAGVVLDLGREQHLANRSQRRALRAMYRTCAVLGCTVPFARCEVHHVTPWFPSGETDIANLAPLCTFHHHRVHDHRWTLTIDQARTVRLYRPDGTLDSTSPLVPFGSLGARSSAGEPRMRRHDASSAGQPAARPPRPPGSAGGADPPSLGRDGDRRQPAA